MKVRELIEALEDQDPEAEVILMTQENWPFENTIAGVVSRGELTEDEEDEEEEEEEDGDGEDAEEETPERSTWAGGGTAPSDVFIVEGSQLRYGSKAAWFAV